jgi:hypothetical protein
MSVLGECWECVSFGNRLIDTERAVTLTKYDWGPWQRNGRQKLAMS